MTADRRALITGITGQDGSYLAELLLEKGYEVHGMIRRSSSLRRERIDHFADTIPAAARHLKLHYGDLADTMSMVRLVREVRPQEVYNLAAQSHVRVSFEQASYTADVTAVGVLRLLEAVRDFQESSGQQVRFYQASRGENFVTRKVTRAAARIKLGLQQQLALGNLEARRDWGFAGDYVKAMWLMLQQESPDDYVIATGETHSVRELCDAAFSHVRLDYRDFVVHDQRLERPAEVDLLVGDASKAREKLGWQPQVSFAELIAMMVNADLEQAERERSRPPAPLAGDLTG
ncbi:MAG: GDP-mannose 4,6-dehydratase [Planctomycetia bacterium]|nr:GDP-mannose 4,6-dehydratase [Planctomycetia bacterium]